MPYKFNLSKFAKDIADARDTSSVRTVRGLEGKEVPVPLGLRSTAMAIGISAPTISRITREISYPDMETLLAVCAWLGESPCSYFEHVAPKPKRTS